VVQRRLGEIELAAGRAHAAIEPLARAHELMPEDARTLDALARAHLRAGDPGSAVRVLRGGSAAFATDPQPLGVLLSQALLRLGQARATAGRSVDALYWTRQAVDSGALPAAGVFLAGMVAREAGDAEFSRELFAQALALDPDLLRKKHDTAVELSEKGEHEQAIALFEEVLVVEPDHAPTLFNLGRTRIQAGRPAEAIDPLERGLARQEDAGARALLEQARAASGS
jgi:tetratricopeptide (TPR) repeat protein